MKSRQQVGGPGSEELKPRVSIESEVGYIKRMGYLSQTLSSK